MFKIHAALSREDFELDVTIRVDAPGVVALFGRSGCGKTTLTNIVAGLLRATSASIEIDGEVLEDTATGRYVPAEHRGIGYVFQDARLFPHLNVEGNLRYGLQRARGRAVRTKFDTVVRVALGRAWLSQPRLLLLDEPFAALDAARREEVLPYLERLRDELSIPMIYVSHQFDEVLRLATHMVLMERGHALAQGRVEEMSLHPELRAIVGPEAIGAVLLGEVETADEHSGLAAIRIGANVLNVNLRGMRPGDAVRVQLLARDVILATFRPEGLSVRNMLAGAVAQVVEDDEDTDLVFVDIGGASVVARVTRAASCALSLRTGVPVWVLVKSVSIRGHAFPAPSAAQ
jgi:molybdate transport system ATP-binding protein